MTFTIRNADAGDIPRVIEIERISFPSPWADSVFWGEMDNPRAFFMVALGEDNQVVGYYDMWIYAGEGHLLNICVAPEFRGKGLGKALLEDALTTAKDGGVDAIYLEARPSNTAAINLYEKYRFVRIGVRKGYYQNGEDALIYALEINPNE